MGFSIQQLDWLEKAPEDLRSRLKEIVGAPGSVAADAIVALARTALNIDQLGQMSNALDRIADRFNPAGLTPLRLAILVDGTADYFVPAIRVTGLRHGLSIATYVPAYGQGLAEILDGDSPLRSFHPDMALVASDYHSIGLNRPRMDPAEANAAVTAATIRLELSLKPL